MISEERGRAVIFCDACPIRLDIGAAAIALQHGRMPSGWINNAPDHHLCPTCARKEFQELPSNQVA